MTVKARERSERERRKKKQKWKERREDGAIQAVKK